MSKPLILVTGAAGKTGSHVVKQLINRGYPVRAFVRRLDDRSQQLSELGTEIVKGDFFDLSTIVMGKLTTCLSLLAHKYSKIPFCSNLSRNSVSSGSK